MSYDEIVKRSLELSQPYWDLYNRLIASKLIDTKTNACVDNQPFSTDHNVDSGDDNQDLNPDYLELIIITREHQANREKQKQKRQKKSSNVETYYKDISQVDTLVEDNLVEAPNRSNKSESSSTKQKEQELIELYGGQEAYESVRSMEMTIDDYFHKKYHELRPGFWPVMPINYKRYLNSVGT